MNIDGFICLFRFSGNSDILTVVEVAEISCIKEEVCSEEISEATLGCAERKWSV